MKIDIESGGRALRHEDTEPSEFGDNRVSLGRDRW